jgi:hypothetical protein
MGLDAIVRSAVATANRITGSLQTTVTHEAWTGKDVYNAPSFAAGVARPALVEWMPELQRGASEEQVRAKAKLTFLEPIAANGATGRREPIDPRDRLTLANGYIGPILRVSGLEDPTTTRPYLLEVWIG